MAILRVWEGGMAFHGGFLGVLVAGIIFARRHEIPYAKLADGLALATPPGLLLGRVANFNDRPPFLPGVRTPVIADGGDVYYHGANVGVEFTW